MGDTYYVVPEVIHNTLVEKAYRHRGYTADEAADAARFCASASTHGIRTHNGIKALHLDHLFGSAAGGCVPGAKIREIPTKFKAARVWDAQKKLGQPVAYRAMETCMNIFELSKRFPPEERYSLTDQIRRSSRSVCTNLAEAWRKRRYRAAFLAKLSDAETEAAETQVWADIAHRSGYWPQETFRQFDDVCDKIMGQIVRMSDQPEKWLIKPRLQP